MLNREAIWTDVNKVALRIQYIKETVDPTINGWCYCLLTSFMNKEATYMSRLFTFTDISIGLVPSIPFVSLVTGKGNC